jgi:crotonobetainyl-CoA:carnitine CoA-transferase CaiB-like acyl-CoA transferase
VIAYNGSPVDRAAGDRLARRERQASFSPSVYPPRTGDANQMNIGPLDPASALQGIRVLDFSHALAGPYCTLILAEYGADVYKLESPTGGDMGRTWGPPFVGGESGYFLGLNRGKKGIAIDLKRPEGIALCQQLIPHMDVLLENFRPGTMKRLGLDYETLRPLNPRLIYCSISGYGQTGPAREEAAMDLILQASSGLISMTGTAAGDRVRSGYSVADITAGMFAVIGILTALQYRERSGDGQYIDVSMFDTMISAMCSNWSTFLASGIEPQPMGTAFATIVPYRCFEASDRPIALAIGSEKLWGTLCVLLDRIDLRDHPHFATNPQRVAHRAELEPLLEAIFRERPARDWVERLQAAGIPCSLIRTFSEVLADPHASARELFPSLVHPSAGQHTVTGAPIKLSLTPGQQTQPAPLLGQHTRHVLQSLLGLDPPTLDSLFASGVLHAPPP